MKTDDLLQLERALYLKPRPLSRVLGIAYSTYMGYREGVRPIPRYVEFHAKALLALPDDTREKIVGERLE